MKTTCGIITAQEAANFPPITIIGPILYHPFMEKKRIGPIAVIRSKLNRFL
jgi:hypothetical protein